MCLHVVSAMRVLISNHQQSPLEFQLLQPKVEKVMAEEDEVVTVDQDLGVVGRKRNLGHAHMSVESALGSSEV